MRTSLFGLVLAGSAAAFGSAPPPPPPEMEAAHQVQREAGQRDWRLDANVFIDLSPVTVAEPALGLPEDQREQPTPDVDARESR